MTARTGLATHDVVTTTPAGEVKLVGTNLLKRDLHLTPDKARSLACALLCEANTAEQEQAERKRPSDFRGALADYWPADVDPTDAVRAQR